MFPSIKSAMIFDEYVSDDGKLYIAMYKGDTFQWVQTEKSDSNNRNTTSPSKKASGGKGKGKQQTFCTGIACVVTHVKVSKNDLDCHSTGTPTPKTYKKRSYV
jgi:hypothetical protein